MQKIDSAQVNHNSCSGAITKKRNCFAVPLLLLSNQDSNLDWLIQSQMCYHYTIGQYFLSWKSDAKVQLFIFSTKSFFMSFHINTL